MSSRLRSMSNGRTPAADDRARGRGLTSAAWVQIDLAEGQSSQWRNEESSLQVIVPEHGGRTLPLGTLRSILKGAEIPESEWRG